MAGAARTLRASCQPASLPAGAVFVEPMAWMADQIVGPVQGKIYCSGCNSRLGHFSWAGKHRPNNSYGCGRTAVCRMRCSKGT